VLLGTLSWAGQAPSWLEASVPNWNKAGAEPPRAPKAPSADPRCSSQARPGVSKDDKAVKDAGWTLVGAAQVFGGTRAFLGAAGFDGMCRPLDYQGFVFVEGQFAGTLAPTPMRARVDGSLMTLRLTSEAALSADFARYLEQDPLCCPSRLASVSYRLEATPAGPLLVVGGTRVEPAPSASRSPATR